MILRTARQKRQPLCSAGLFWPTDHQPKSSWQSTIFSQQICPDSCPKKNHMYSYSTVLCLGSHMNLLFLATMFLFKWCLVKNNVCILDFNLQLCSVDCQAQGGLPSYSFSLMAIHFLQQTQPPLLPLLDPSQVCPEFVKCGSICSWILFSWQTCCSDGGGSCCSPSVRPWNPWIIGT